MASAPDGAVAESTPKARARKPVLYMFGAIVVVGLVFLTLSFQYDFLLGKQIGPGFLPRVAAIGLILMGVLLIIDELRAGSILVGDGAIAVVEEQTKDEVKKTHRKLIIVAVLTPIACLLFPILGLLPSLTILAFVLSAFVEKMPKIRSAIVAVVTFGVLYLIFIVVLQVPLPFGIFDPQFWRA